MLLRKKLILFITSFTIFANIAVCAGGPKEKDPFDSFPSLKTLAANKVRENIGIKKGRINGKYDDVYFMRPMPNSSVEFVQSKALKGQSEDILETLFPYPLVITSLSFPDLREEAIISVAPHLIINSNVQKNWSSDGQILEGEMADYTSLICLILKMAQKAKKVSLNFNLWAFSSSLKQQCAHQFASTLANLPDLQELDFHMDWLETLPKGFAILTRLRVLNLSDNALRDIDVISAVTKLEQLNLYWNKLEALPKGFTTLTHLRYLNLSNNTLHNIDVLGSLTKLEKLNLRSNKLEALPEEVITLINLRHLNLSGNELKDVGVLGALTNLEKLDLYSNELLALSETITMIKNLRRLDLGHNELQNVGVLCALTNLVELDLQQNELDTLPEGITALKNLRFLNIAKIFLEDRRILSMLTNLKELGIKDQYLEDIAILTNLKCLNLSHEKHEQNVRFPESLTNLKKLKLNHEVLPEGVAVLTNLLSLDAVLNEITGIETLSNLRKLDLCCPRLKVLPESFTALTNLRRLDLSGVNLKNVTGIEVLSKLKKLNLCCPRLKVLPEGFSTLMNLQQLKLDANKKLENIGILATLTNVEKLDFNEYILETLLEKTSRLKCVISPKTLHF